MRISIEKASVEHPARHSRRAGVVMGNSAREQRALALILGSAVLIQTMDVAAVATALPTISRGLQVDALRVSFALTMFLVGAAVSLPASGWAADRFGTRNVFLFGIGAYGLSALASGAAQTLEQLIFARTLQGASSAMLLPIGRLILLRAVPRHQFVQASAWLNVPALLGPVVGAPLSGLIIMFASWRWIFLINIPLAVVGMILITRYVPNLRSAEKAPFDKLGFALSAVAVAGLAIGVGSLGRKSIPFSASGVIALGLVFVLLFALHERRAPAPLLRLYPLKDRTFFLITAGGIFARLPLGASPFLLAAIFQVGLRMSPLESGLLIFFIAIGSILVRPVTALIIRHVGFRPVILLSGVLAAASFGLCFAFSPATPKILIMASLLVHGFFRGLHVTCLNTAAYADLEANEMTSATTLSGVFQQLSQSLGIGLAASIVEMLRVFRGHTGLELYDLQVTVAVIAGVTSLSLAFFAGLSRSVGASYFRTGSAAEAVASP